MRATVLLADAAQTDPQGKVHALGLGWTVTSSPTPPMALVVLIEVDWTESNRKFPFRAELLTADGHPVTTQTPLGEQPVTLEGDFEAGRPPGIPAGTPLAIPFAVNLGPGFPLVHGQRYEWRVHLDGRTEESWAASFLVREA